MAIFGKKKEKANAKANAKEEVLQQEAEQAADDVLNTDSTGTETLQRKPSRHT